ncbi:hypothetical protein [Microbulbifer aestuariivivens]|uniref:hypothetical protein n=1 Tax=Microbulbifer aestuariivivens TaxID=1908308 RepID=UPI0031E5BE3B
MRTINLFFIILISFLLPACAIFDVYRNAHEPVNRNNKEDWALVSVSKGNRGQILISPRPKDNPVKAVLSAGNHLARANILLDEGLNDINLYVFDGAYGAMLVIKDIPIKSKGEYLVKYNIEGRRITSWVVDKKTGKRVR